MSNWRERADNAPRRRAEEEAARRGKIAEERRADLDADILPLFDELEIPKKLEEIREEIWKGGELFHPVYPRFNSVSSEIRATIPDPKPKLKAGYREEQGMVGTGRYETVGSNEAAHSYEISEPGIVRELIGERIIDVDDQERLHKFGVEICRFNDSREYVVRFSRSRGILDSNSSLYGLTFPLYTMLISDSRLNFHLGDLSRARDFLEERLLSFVVGEKETVPQAIARSQQRRALIQSSVGRWIHDVPELK